MQRSQPQTDNLSLRAERTDRVSAMVTFWGWFSGLWQNRAEDKIAARYDGCAWCDSIEHQLTNDIMTGNRSDN